MVKIMKNNPIKTIIFVVIIIISLTALYLILDKLFTPKNVYEGTYLKNYKVNEYISTYISDEDMAKIYLNDYIHNMYYDVEKAYNLLDQEYRDKRFGSIEKYKAYVRTLNYSTYNLESYYKKTKEGYIIFGVRDENFNLFIFKTKGVMQYKVFLDDFTVEI